MARPRVLLVCTANICRSPAAQRLLAARVGPRVEFFSRGVSAVPGAGMCGVSGNWLATRNAFGVGAGSALAHKSQKLVPADIDESSLVLAATENQRAKILSMDPRSQAITYTLLEAARIARHVESQGIVPPPGATPEERLEWLVETLWQHRASTPPEPTPRTGISMKTGRVSLLGRRNPSPVHEDSLLDPHDGGGDHAPVLEVLDRTIRAIALPLRT